ncbi:hypothetical protein RGR602_CH00570 [Rhizobium gallicum bv. gallicum R602sp]|uniref:Uncharacterized protein n=1 Tax=Rhizobium gallicum bv. gallicum R602sp TaxID=1041138 RepID=A0A0B4WZH1_9HYPH|nr:hypothetical protein RGR602_CH00570 [Rhizobium gallicum bv. gallicum R602sp]
MVASVIVSAPQVQPEHWDVQDLHPLQQQRAKPNQQNAIDAMRTLLLSPSSLPKRNFFAHQNAR